MYYIVINGEIKKTEEQNFWDCDNGICVVKLSEWNESPGACGLAFLCQTGA